MDNYYNDNYGPLESRENNKKFMIFGAALSTIVGITILIYYINKVSESHSLPEKGETLNLVHFGAFGDFVGGFIGTLFSLAGIFLLYLTLKEQRENFNKERLENNFFEMIKFHKENVNELEFTYYENEKQDSKTKAVKRKVFKIIFSQYKDLWNELDFLFIDRDIKTIYNAEKLNELKNNDLTKNVNFIQLAKIDIVFLIIFFGIGKDDKRTIQDLTKNHYNEDFIFEVLSFSSLKPKRNSVFWHRWKSINGINDVTMKQKVLIDFFKIRNDKYIYNEETFKYFDQQEHPVDYPDNYDKFYGGHQFRLGHYYRHFYQNIKFINDQVYLTYNEKYSYIKLLRVHLSNYEQIMLFFNSLSLVGRKLEFSQPSLNNQLITKYNLIKNIPNQTILDSIELKDYYPFVKYETFPIEYTKRKKLLKFYR